MKKLPAINKLSNCILLLIASALPSPLLANPSMTPGGWETMMSVTATNPNNGQQVNVGNNTVVFCLTSEFLATDPYLKPSLNEAQMRQKGASCSTSEQSRSSTSAQWKMSCDMRGQPLESIINVSIAPESYTSKIEQIIGTGDNAVHSVITVNSRRIGDCTDSMPRP